MYIKKEDSKSDTIEPSCYKRYELILLYYMNVRKLPINKFDV